jgi:hypothetical protein
MIKMSTQNTTTAYGDLKNINNLASLALNW